MGPFMNWNRHEALAKWRWTQLYICMGRFTNDFLRVPFHQNQLENTPQFF